MNGWNELVEQGAKNGEEWAIEVLRQRKEFAESVKTMQACQYAAKIQSGWMDELYNETSYWENYEHRQAWDAWEKYKPSRNELLAQQRLGRRRMLPETPDQIRRRAERIEEGKRNQQIREEIQRRREERFAEHQQQGRLIKAWGTCWPEIALAKAWREERASVRNWEKWYASAWRKSTQQTRSAQREAVEMNPVSESALPPHISEEEMIYDRVRRMRDRMVRNSRRKLKNYNWEESGSFDNLVRAMEDAYV